MDSRCEGTFEVRSERLNDDPGTRAHGFDAHFAEDGSWSVSVESFGELTFEDVETGQDDKTAIRVSLARPAEGTLDRATGHLLLKARPVFDFGIGPIRMRLELNTQAEHTLADGSTWKGVPVDPQSGSFVMVGTGTFVEAFVNGERLVMRVKGTLQPSPMPA